MTYLSQTGPHLGQNEGMGYGVLRPGGSQHVPNSTHENSLGFRLGLGTGHQLHLGLRVRVGLGVF